MPVTLLCPQPVVRECMLDELLTRTDPSAAGGEEYDSDLYGEEPVWRRGGGGRLLGRLRSHKAPKKKKRGGPNVSEWKLYLVQGEEGARCLRRRYCGWESAWAAWWLGLAWEGACLLQ